MTSNLGSQMIAEIRDEEHMRKEVMEVVREHFRPEFLNRIDDIIIFHALSKEDISRIVEIQLKSLQRLLDQKHLKLDLTQGARDFLSRVGYDPVYGARPLKRAIQQYVQNPLAMELLKGSIQEGDSVVADYDAATDQLVFGKDVPVSGVGV